MSNGEQPKKKRAYTRRNSGETPAHKKRRPESRSVFYGLNSTEIKEACDKFLRSRGVPVNSFEEQAIKESVKQMRAARKGSRRRDDGGQVDAE